MPDEEEEVELEPGFIIIEQQIDLGGQVLHLSGKVNLVGLPPAQREVLLDLMDTFARLGKKSPGRRARRVHEEESG